MRTTIPRFALQLTFAATLHASAPSGFSADEPSAATPPIQEIAGVSPSGDLFGDWKTPTLITSSEEAEKHFAGDALAALVEKVDFESQIVLVFAWRGSGQDKLSFDVAESFPEQISFKLAPGRTRDLRPHVHVFVLRKGVRWSAG